MTMKEQKLEKQIQKQMGCMAGFLQIFDRHHILTGKRLHCGRRLPLLPPAGDTTSDSGKSAPPSPVASGELRRETPATELPPKLPWKFKETPRLSLDSRATTDAKGGLHPREIRISDSILSDVPSSNAGDGSHNRSPSVIARLMGLEPIPNSSDSPPVNRPELRRSASESRVSKDLFRSRLITDSALDDEIMHPHYTDRNQPSRKNVKSEVSDGLSRRDLNQTSSWRAPPPRKSFYEYGDVFPAQKQNASSIYGKIEKRLKMRGIDEPSKDLDTLKQILEALQLKGLLHSKPPPLPHHHNHVRRRNFVHSESPIVLIKPSRSPPSKPTNSRKQDGVVRRNHTFTGETSPSPSPRRERNVRSSIRSPTRSNSPVKPKQPLTQRRVNEPAEHRASPAQSPKINGTRLDRSPRSKKPTVVITHKEKITTVAATVDSSSSASGSSVTTSTDTERCKGDQLKEAMSLLERCDKLLHSIAEFAATDLQPSPVSVLDSSLYKDESLTPSPVPTKRSIHFNDQYGESEEEILSPVVSPIRSKFVDSSSDDCDFAYVSDILRASHNLPDESDVFMLLEKQQHLKGNDTSKVSWLQRKLIFDTISEILERDARLPPWKAVSSSSHRGETAADKVWSEFQRIRECDIAEDLFETVCRVLKKDLAGDAVTGWGDCPVEMSEAVLDIERLVFKDMVSEIIEDLSALSPSMMPRRKLVF